MIKAEVKLLAGARELKSKEYWNLCQKRKGIG